MSAPALPLVALLGLSLVEPAPDNRSPEPDLAADEVPATWDQWRGPSRDGRVAGPAWPADLSEERLRLRWRVAGLGPSYSGPIVTPERVFTTETRGERDEVVRAFDRASGEELWTATWAGSMQVPFFAARNGSWIRSTPAWDGEALFVAGMRDVLVCLDGATGEERWRVDFTERYGAPLPDFGFVCSPLVAGEHVYVQAGASFCKLDKRTGETVWRTMTDGGGMLGSAFSSPVMGTLGGVEQLVVQSRSHLAGVDPDSGALVWSTPVKAFRGMNILTPMVVADDAVFTSTYGGRSQLFTVERGEEGWTVEQAWDDRTQGYMTSPVIVDGHAYLFLRANRFACVDLAAGSVRWISEPTGDEYWSLAVQGDRILALAQDGTLRLVRANPERYEVLDERSVSEAETWAHVAPAGHQIAIREQGALALYDWQ